MRAELGDAYVIERELDGGMSCVFVAEDRELARRVVIKVLHPHLAASVSVERFRREILTVAKLQHPHIVGVLRTGTAQGLPYFIMPYVDGESLANHLTAGRMPVRDTVAVLKDVARALAFAHDRGVVHRDIKPGNILLAGGSAMVTDFGVAKALSSARRTAADNPAHALTTDGTSIGTMLYMAPEQAAADPDIDGRADIYSLGATAYEMLTGAPPFAGLPARAMLAARMSTLPPAISTVRDDVPDDLNDLLMRCLASDPAGRPSTAQDLVEALEGPGVVSGEFARVPRPRGRRALASIGAGLALIAIVGAGVATSRVHHGSGATLRGAAVMSPFGEIAVVPFVDLGPDSAGETVAIGITNAVADNLTKSAHLKVISPTASAALVREIRSGTARPSKGGPQLLLEGTVQREGSKLRVTARLSNASDGVMRWADVYDRDGRDLFKVTDDIAAAIVASIKHPSA
jgi:TolB-like protein/tRNA A-37 threonylcarbamoyl transferase component Bud32